MSTRKTISEKSTRHERQEAFVCAVTGFSVGVILALVFVDVAACLIRGIAKLFN